MFISIAAAQHRKFRMQLALVTRLQRHLHLPIDPIAGDRMFDDALFDESKSGERDVPYGARGSCV